MQPLKRAAVCMAVVLAMIFSSANHLAAQTDDLWLYRVTESHDRYNLLRVAISDRHSELILTLPKILPTSLLSMIPTAEANAARSFLQEYAESYWVTDVDQFLSYPPEVIIRSLSPSPDNETVALNVTYQNCARGPGVRMACFGMSQVVLVSGSTGQQQVVLELGFHTDEFFPASRGSSGDVQIEDLIWLPDQQGLIAALSDYLIRANFGNRSLVVIPLVPNVGPFKIGDGISWAVAPNSREMAAISYTSGLVFTLQLISFDPSTGVFSTIDYLQDPYIITPEFGLAFLNNANVFQIAYDKSLLYDIEYPNRLGVYSPGQPAPLTIVRPEIGGYKRIQSVITGEVAVIESDDGRLWKATIPDGNLIVEPLTNGPVTFWRIVKGNTLVFQREGRMQYEVRDLMLRNTLN